MGTVAGDTENDVSDVYISLGLKELGKKVKKFPRVLSLLSSLLERYVQRNEIILQATQITNAITIFHGLRAPCLSIRHYVERIFKYSGCSPSCFVAAHVYLDRYIQCTDVHLTSLNVHRLIITSVMLAAKFMDDAFFNNAYYAKVGGVSTGELNKLEMKFLFTIDFRLQVSEDTFGKHCWKLDNETTEQLQIERPIQACGIKKDWSNEDEDVESSQCIMTQFSKIQCS